MLHATGSRSAHHHEDVRPNWRSKLRLDSAVRDTESARGTPASKCSDKFRVLFRRICMEHAPATDDSKVKEWRSSLMMVQSGVLPAGGCPRTPCKEICKPDYAIVPTCVSICRSLPLARAAFSGVQARGGVKPTTKANISMKAPCESFTE